MPRTLRGQTALAFLVLSLGSILLVSLLAHLQIQRHLALYYRERVEHQALRVAEALAATYQPGRGWPDPVLTAVARAQPPEVRGLVLEDAAGRATLLDSRAARPSPGAPVSRPVLVAGRPVATLYLYPATATATLAESHFRAGVAQALAGAAVLAAALATAAAGLAVGRLHRPLRDMTAVARAIRAGERQLRAPRPAVAELRELADALNDLAAWLERSEALRRRLTRDVAHQLRTPLAVLRSHLEALRDGVWAPTPDRIARCHDEVVKLIRRVHDLDRLLEAEAAPLSLQRAEVTLGQLLDPLVASFAPLFAQRGLDFRSSVPDPQALLRVDPDKVAQIVSNLLDNALKYAPPGAAVVLSAEATGDEVCIAVANTGPGIPEDEVPHLFERFYRGTAARQGVPGSGLGLAIARALAEAHGGSIEVRNEPGRAVAFTVRLPRGVDAT